MDIFKVQACLTKSYVLLSPFMLILGGDYEVAFSEFVEILFYFSYLGTASEDGKK